MLILIYLWRVSWYLPPVGRFLFRLISCGGSRFPGSGKPVLVALMHAPTLHDIYMRIYVYIHIYLYVCVYVCMCVCIRHDPVHRNTRKLLNIVCYICTYIHIHTHILYLEMY